MELGVTINTTEQKFANLEITSKQATYKRYNSAAPRRRLKSAGIISQKRSTLSHGFLNSTKKEQTSATFFQKIGNFMSTITNSKNFMADGILNSPFENNFSNTNRFRPTFNRRCVKYRKLQKPQPNELKELEFFMKTVTQEFGIFQPKFSIELLGKGESTAMLPTSTKASQPTLFASPNKQFKSFESQSRIRLKTTKNERPSFSISGRKYF